MKSGVPTARLALLLAAACPAALCAQAHRAFYVAPDGRPGAAGTRADPWDLRTALAGAGGRVAPGDTIWLGGGTYRGSFTSRLEGTLGAPIVVRQAPGARAVLDGAEAPPHADILQVDGGWTVFWGFEITNSSLERAVSRRTGVYLRHAHDVKLVHLVIHDTGMGVFAEAATPGVEIYGCIIYDGGWQTATRSNGHGLYVKQDRSGAKLIRDNILFDNFGFGLHAYTDRATGALDNLTVEGNVAFDNGTLSVYPSANLLVGGMEPVDDAVVRDNMTWFAPGVKATSLRLGYQSDIVNGGMTATGNYLVGGSPVLEIGHWRAATVDGNTLWGDRVLVRLHEGGRPGYVWRGNRYSEAAAARAWETPNGALPFAAWREVTGLGASDVALASTPPPSVVFVRPSAYEPGRATVVIYNWAERDSVAVTLAGVLRPGDRYEVRNVQDLFGRPVVAGTFTGAAVVLPMGGVEPPAPVGGSPVAPRRTGPFFDVFVIRRVR